MKNKHTNSNLMTLAGFLMIISSILMMSTGNIPVGGMFLAAASCMFFTAYNFRLSENKKEKTEESKDEKEIIQVKRK